MHLDSYAGNIKGAGLDASETPPDYLGYLQYAIYNRLEVEKELMRKRYWSQIPQMTIVLCMKYNHNEMHLKIDK